MKHFIHIFAPGSYSTVALVEVAESEIDKIKESIANDGKGFVLEPTVFAYSTYWVLRESSAKEGVSHE
jgi:hypothetical protein